jgi:acyl carrier protein
VAEAVEERLVEVMRTVFGDDDIEVTDDTTAADIPEWDSLANINLLFALEEEFGLRFRDDDFASFTKVGDLRQYLETNA